MTRIEPLHHHIRMTRDRVTSTAASGGLTVGGGARQPAADDAQAQTLASVVFDRLREDILQGHLPPGEKLRLEGLRERYGVGGSPVREALNRLTAVRLVEQTDRRGFRVATLSREDLIELLRSRCLLNEIVVRESLVNGDHAWEDQLVLAFRRMGRSPMTTPDGQVNREWELLHRAFHAALIAACPARRLREFHEELFDAADRHRRMNAQRLDPKRSEVEHRDIMKAALSRDVALTVRLLNDAATSLEYWASSDGKTASRRPRGSARNASAASADLMDL